MGESLVLVPGMMCDARLYGPQIAAFSGRHTLILPSLAGQETVGEMAASVLAQAPERFALLGLSMGGIVAMEMMRLAPGRVSRLCLMDTNALAETPAVAAAREPQIVGAKSGRLAEIMRDEMKPNYLAPGLGRRAVLDLVMEMALGLGPEVFVRQSRALQKRPDQQRVLREIRVPTLVACGAHDALCPLRRHELMAELIPGAVLEVIDGAGHLPVLEQPEQVNALLRDWLDWPETLRRNPQDPAGGAGGI